MRPAPIRLALAALVLLAPGCIPLPVALPPAKGTIGIGAAVGNPLPSRLGPLSRAEAMVIGRVGLALQSLWPEQHRRIVEVEAGYSFQILTNRYLQDRNRHGGYVGVSLLAGDWSMGHTWRARLVFRGNGEFFVLQGYPGDGGGGSFGVGFEAARYNQQDTWGGRGLRYMGLAAGEWSIGGELFGGYYSVGNGQYGTVGVALTVRWPGLLGVAVIPFSASL